MARPKKRGLEYWPFDVDFFDDEKIEAISGEFGPTGEIVIIRLFCALYRNGYYIEWTKMLQMKILRALQGQATAEQVNAIVERCAEWGLFNEELFRNERILTSVAIQKRYFLATSRRKDCPTEYLLVNINSDHSDNINVNNNSVSPGINEVKSTQSKVKESKVNKSYSFGEGPGGQKQKEQFLYQIFYLKNFYDPWSEVHRFINWNKVRGWKLKNGQTITTYDQLKAAALLWKPENESPRLDPQFMRIWGCLYALAPDALKHEMVNMHTSFKTSFGKSELVCKKNVYDWLEENSVGEAGQIFRNFLNGRELKVKTF